MPDRLRYDCQSNANDDAASENEFSAKVIHDDSPFRLILKSGLWKNLMLATALTVVLGTAPVTAFAADVDSTVTEAEQTTPQADTTVKEEVAEPEVKAITVDVTTSSTTFDGTQDIVIMMK